MQPSDPNRIDPISDLSVTQPSDGETPNSGNEVNMEVSQPDGLNRDDLAANAPGDGAKPADDTVSVDEQNEVRPPSNKAGESASTIEPNQDEEEADPNQTDERPDSEINSEALVDESSFDVKELLGIVEALIFGAEESLSAGRICDIIDDTTGERPTPQMIDEAVDWLNSVYENGQRSFRIREWGEGYRMATDPAYASYLKAMYFQHRETKLSRSLLETLAILAYKQPATKPEIDHIRGVDSDYAIRRLMELGFVEIGGRSESVGKPLLYRSTELFMDKFGLASLDDLPTLREMEELLNDPSFSSEKAHLLMKQGLDLPDDSELSEQHSISPSGATVANESAIEIQITSPLSVLSETADASSGDGAPPETDTGSTHLSHGSDTDPDGS